MAKATGNQTQTQPLRRSPRIAARQARRQPYPQPARTPAREPTSPPLARESEPAVMQERGTPPINRPNKAEARVKKERERDEDEFENEVDILEERKVNGGVLLHIPFHFPQIGPNLRPGEELDPRYQPGRFIVDEGVRRRVLGRGEVATLSVWECLENWDLF